MKKNHKKIGVGLRNPHLFFFANGDYDVPLLEIHSENFFNPHGREFALLEQVAEKYPLSFHGVGLSLGSFNGLNQNHLKKLSELNQHFKPKFFSEHISWSEHEQSFYNDLMPIPYNKQSLEVICRNISTFQDFLGREILVENPSNYISFKDSIYHEAEFLNLICERTKCKLLIDVNNIYVSSHNLALDSLKYLEILDHNNIAELHIAGPEEVEVKQEKILLDSHSSYPKAQAISLLKKILTKIDVPVIFEWDTNIPELSDFISYKERIEAEINA